VAAAVRKGTLTRKPCAVCGIDKVQGHHSDYTRPLYVIWLCQKHHLEIHAPTFSDADIVIGLKVILGQMTPADAQYKLSRTLGVTGSIQRLCLLVIEQLIETHNPTKKHLENQLRIRIAALEDVTSNQ